MPPPINLGNVSGIVISNTPPTEEDGVTLKKYVLWGRPTTGDNYTIYYWETAIENWSPLGISGVIDDTEPEEGEQQSLSTTFSAFKISQLLAGKADAAGSKPLPQGDSIFMQSVGNSGDTAQPGDWALRVNANDEFVIAVYDGGDPTDDANYSNERKYTK